jgi:hypothetical protein
MKKLELQKQSDELWTKLESELPWINEDRHTTSEGILANYNDFKEEIDKIDEEDLILGLSGLNPERLKNRETRTQWLKEMGLYQEPEEEEE